MKIVFHPSSLRLHASNLARVPGIGLLNRTLKSWVERHEVRLLRGPPKYISDFRFQIVTECSVLMKLGATLTIGNEFNLQSEILNLQYFLAV
jgi:hypothetical protein